MDQITDNLYLGDIRAAANLFLLKSHVRRLYLILTNVILLGRHSHFASAGWSEPLLPIRN